jgi:hypothetical protein
MVAEDGYRRQPEMAYIDNGKQNTIGGRTFKKQDTSARKHLRRIRKRVMIRFEE